MVIKGTNGDHVKDAGTFKVSLLQFDGSFTTLDDHYFETAKDKWIYKVSF